MVSDWFESTRLKIAHPDYRKVLQGMVEAQPSPVCRPARTTSNYCGSASECHLNLRFQQGDCVTIASAEMAPEFWTSISVVP